MTRPISKICLSFRQGVFGPLACFRGLGHGDEHKYISETDVPGAQEERARREAALAKADPTWDGFSCTRELPPLDPKFKGMHDAIHRQALDAMDEDSQELLK